MFKKKTANADVAVGLDLDPSHIAAAEVRVNGSISMGSSGNAGQGEPNLIYDPTVFPPLQAYGTAGIIQNTWRELTAG